MSDNGHEGTTTSNSQNESLTTTAVEGTESTIPETSNDDTIIINSTSDGSVTVEAPASEGGQGENDVPRVQQVSATETESEETTQKDGEDGQGAGGAAAATAAAGGTQDTTIEPSSTTVLSSSSSTTPPSISTSDPVNVDQQTVAPSSLSPTAEQAAVDDDSTTTTKQDDKAGRSTTEHAATDAAPDSDSATLQSHQSDEQTSATAAAPAVNEEDAAATTTTGASEGITENRSSSLPAESNAVSASMSNTGSATGSASGGNGGGASSSSGAAGAAGTAARPVAPKKFTSSLSMNKKFLEKSGATDAKSPQPASASLPRAGSSPVARSPAIASPSIPAHPGTSASPPITTSTSAPTSHPRLLTGKLSSLSAGSGSGVLGSSPSSATWGRPAFGANPGGAGGPGGASSTAFGKTGFVPAPPVVASGIAGLAKPGPGVPTLGRMRGFGSGRSAQAPWGAAGRPGGPTSRNGPMEHDFPSFQEAAKAEEKRQNALLAKEQAEKMAAAQQAAYNQRVLEGLKSFSGEYISGTSHWDELDDDDDDLGDILEFADGTRYEVPQSATLPAAGAAEPDVAAQAQAQAPAAAQAQAQQATSVGQQKQQQPLAQGAASATPSDQAQRKSERFVDDFDRGQRGSVAANIAAALEASANQNAAARQPQSGRTLFNDRLGRFEPYAGRQPSSKDPRQQQQQLSQQQQKSVPQAPAALLQRTSKSALSPQEQARPSPTARAPSGGQQAPPHGAKMPASTQQQQATASQPPAPPRKVDSPWAKLPPVPKPGPLDKLTDHDPSPSASASAQQTTTLPSTTAPAPAPVQAQAQPAPPAAPAVPAEDPEEAYRKQMRNIAETARKRRQDEEAEREAQKERARKKAQELEEKMKSPTAAPAAALTPTQPTQPTILAPPATRSDRESNWRRASVTDAKVPQAIHQRKASQAQNVPPATQLRANFNGPQAQDNRAVQQAQFKSAPSAAAFAALAEVASASWRSQQDGQAPAGRDAALSRTDAVRSSNDAKPAGSLEADELLASPPSTVPRVRLGRRASPEFGTGPPREPFSVPHAFPQPTIIVGRGNADYAAHPHAPRPTSALDKIMLQVRAAQDDLKTRQTAAAMLEEEKRRLHGSSQEDFESALKRISSALNEAIKSGKGKDREPAPPVQMFVRYIPEPFEYTRLERPGTPRSWKIFNVKVPSVSRPAPPTLSFQRIRFVDDPNIPNAIFSSSWIPPRGVRLPRNTTLEAYLAESGEAKVTPRVKFSKLYLPSVAADDELLLDVAQSGSVRVTTPSVSARQLDGQLGSWRPSERALPVQIQKETITRHDPPLSADEEEDMATMRFEAEDGSPATIKVSLPKKVLSQLSQAVSAPKDQATLDSGRFRAYGPKLPENSTVAFRRGISPVKNAEPADLSDKHSFMVNSELNGSREEPQPSLSTRATDQQVIDEVSAPSKASVAAAAERERAAREAAGKLETGRPSPTSEPVFPSLFLGSARNIETQDTTSQQASAFTSTRREELPRHVIAELERLNASVSSAPLTVPPRLDTPASLLAGRSASPWGVTNSKASMMPSALSLSAIDPSMSVWSKPTEETAAAAAAAFNSAVHKETTHDSVQENSLRDLADDYPSSMPSNAMDLPISDGERPQSNSSEAQGHSPSRSRSHERSPHVHQMSISQVMNASSSPGVQSSMHAPRGSHGASSRHGSFAFSPGPVYAGERSPYTVHTQLPYSPVDPMTMQHGHQTMYSPGLSHHPSSAQYGGFVAAGTPSYAASYSPATVAHNGMAMLSPAYSSMQVAMTGQDGRGVSGHVASNGSLWVPSGSMQGAAAMMNGGYTTAGGMSPYNTSAIGAGAPAYPGGSGGAGAGKTRVHSSPMYHHHQPHQQQPTSPHYQQRGSPVGVDSQHQHQHQHQHQLQHQSQLQQASYAAYGYPGTSVSPQGHTAQTMSTAHHPYSTFSPQLQSTSGAPASGSGRGGYAGHVNGPIGHLRSASAQQYSRRQGW